MHREVIYLPLTLIALKQSPKGIEAVYTPTKHKKARTQQKGKGFEEEGTPGGAALYDFVRPNLKRVCDLCVCDQAKRLTERKQRDTGAELFIQGSIR